MYWGRAHPSIKNISPTAPPKDRLISATTRTNPTNMKGAPHRAQNPPPPADKHGVQRSPGRPAERGHSESRGGSRPLPPEGPTGPVPPHGPRARRPLPAPPRPARTFDSRHGAARPASRAAPERRAPRTGNAARKRKP